MCQKADWGLVRNKGVYCIGNMYNTYICIYIYKFILLHSVRTASRIGISVVGNVAPLCICIYIYICIGLGVFCYAASVFSYAPGWWVLGFMLVVLSVM